MKKFIFCYTEHYMHINIKINFKIIFISIKKLFDNAEIIKKLSTYENRIIEKEE